MNIMSQIRKGAYLAISKEKVPFIFANEQVTLITMETLRILHVHIMFNTFKKNKKKTLMTSYVGFFLSEVSNPIWKNINIKTVFFFFLPQFIKLTVTNFFSKSFENNFELEDAIECFFLTLCRIDILFIYLLFFINFLPMLVKLRPQDFHRISRVF